MILGLVVIALFFVASVCFAVGIRNNDDDVGEFGAGALVIGLFLLALLTFGAYFSLDSAIELDATYNGVVTEYGHAIEKYTEDSIVIRVSEQTLSDFRYSGYQENIAGLIKDLRNQTSEYNRDLIEKRAYNRNPVFSWFVILPPDSLRLISLIDY